MRPELSQPQEHRSAALGRGSGGERKPFCSCCGWFPVGMGGEVLFVHDLHDFSEKRYEKVRVSLFFCLCSNYIRFESDPFFSASSTWMPAFVRSEIRRSLWNWLVVQAAG